LCVFNMGLSISNTQLTFRFLRSLFCNA
jgi:hypothetical protein